MEQDATVLPFQRRSYEAKAHSIAVDGLDMKVSGTLDGYIDLAIGGSDGQRLTWSLSCDGARMLIAALNGTITDIQTNCLFHRDPLLIG